MTHEQLLALTDALTATSRALRTGQDVGSEADVIDRAVKVLTPAPDPAPAPVGPLAA